MAFSLRLIGRCLSSATKSGVRPSITGVPLQTTSLLSAPKQTSLILPAVDQRRHYAMRLELTEYGIVWRRPKYEPCWEPEKSGDLESLKQVESSSAKLEMLPVKDALEQADDVTKRLLSLEFGARKDTSKVQKYDMIRKIQRHQYDTGSMEVTIAMLTVKIRILQQDVLKNKKDIIKKCHLKETIDRRKKLLKHLRRMDYKRFEWLIEELKILYRPPPRYYRWITRKASLKKLVRMRKRDIIHKKLNEYKETLEGQKETFLKEKAETLKWIAETEKHLGVPVSVTVPEESKVVSE